MKKFFCILLILVSICFVGCNSNKNTNSINAINTTITEVKNIISNLEILPDQYYSYLNYDNSSNCDCNANNSKSNYQTVNTNYIYQNIYNENSDTVFLIKSINSKSSNVLAICNIVENNNKNFNDNHNEAISHLCDSISYNISYLKEHNYNDIYNKNNYIQILNNLEACNSCLNNICFGLDNIYDILNEYKTYKTYKETNTNKKSWSNIDTYGNSNKVTTKNNNQIYNNYGYGHGGTNPYYSLGYGRFGFGGYPGMNGFGRYPYSPFSNYNPYMPNIDTFGTYTNTDTYYPQNYKNQNIEVTNLTESQDEYNKPYLPKHECKECEDDKEQSYISE